ncbi:MAG: ABC transporter substrate-binding protein, partial [Dehalococcoidia bacterium]
DPVKSASYESANIYTPTYSRLVRAQYGTEMTPYNPWALGKIVGDLAESWTHPDPLTYIFKLRPNVKFQNVDPVKGRAFTSADAKYSLDLFLANKETGAQLPFTVEAPDPQTVKLNLTKPANYVLQALMDPRFVMLAHEVADADGDFSKRAIGTGPFILDNFVPNTVAHYKRNPDYYRPDRPYFDAMQFDNLKDNAAYKAAVIAGQYDFWEYGFPSPDDFKDLLAARKDTVVLKLQSRWQSNVFHFGFPADKDPWKDVKVRTAISKGFDRSVYGKQAYNGDYNVLGAYPWINFFDSAPDLGDAYKFDPQAAKQLLSAAGVPSPLNVPLDFFPYSGDAGDQLQSIQQQLKAVGINLTLNQMDAVAFITKYYGQKADNPVIGFIPTPPRWAPLSMNVLWHSGSPKNYLRLSDPDLDAALEKVASVEDPAELKKAYQAAWLKLHQPVHFFTFPEQPTQVANAPKLHGVLPNQYNDPAGWGNSAMEDWWLGA